MVKHRDLFLGILLGVIVGMHYGYAITVAHVLYVFAFILALPIVKKLLG